MAGQPRYTDTRMLAYLTKCQEAGIEPTRREIGEELNLQHNVIGASLDRLEAAGKIRRERYGRRVRILVLP